MPAESRPLRLYVASRLENHAAVRELLDAARGKGWEPTYDWTTHGSVWQPAAEGRWDVLRDTALKESEGVMNADVVVVLLPGGRGTHVELGIAIGFGVPVLLWAPTQEHLETLPVCFWGHPLVQRVVGSSNAAWQYNEPQIPAHRILAAANRWRNEVRDTLLELGSWPGPDLGE